MNKIKEILKRLLGTRYVLKVSKGNRFIFVYHDISDEDSPHHSPHYSTPVSTFQEHISLLSSIFEWLPLQDIVANAYLNPGKNYAAITFDDGFESVLRHAKPILDHFHIPYALFINGAAVEHNQIWVSNIETSKAQDEYPEKLLRLSGVTLAQGEDPTTAIIDRGQFSQQFRASYRKEGTEPGLYMNKEDLAQLAEQGVTIGSHSYDHFVLSTTPGSELSDQITHNDELLSSITHSKPRHFAIPFGKKEHFNESIIEELRREGYKYIYTTNPNRFRAADLATEGFLYPRIGLTAQTRKELLFYINRAILKQYHL